MGITIYINHFIMPKSGKINRKGTRRHTRRNRRNRTYKRRFLLKGGCGVCGGIVGGGVTKGGEGCGCDRAVGGSVGLDVLPANSVAPYYDINSNPTNPSMVISEHNTPNGFGNIGYLGGGRRRRGRGHNNNKITIEELHNLYGKRK